MAARSLFSEAGSTVTSPRLLYVLWRYPQVSQTFVRDEIAGLRDAGATVDVITLEAGDTTGIDPEWPGPFRTLARPRVSKVLADHLWLLRGRPRQYAAFLAGFVRRGELRKTLLRRVPSEARRVIEGGGVDACHTHFGWKTASVAAALGGLVDAPASVTLHAKDIYTEPPGRLRTRLAGFHRIFTVCNYNVGYLVASGAVSATDARIRQVFCAVDVPDAPASKRDLDVLAVGRLVEKKGFDTLIDAFGVVVARFPEARLKIVGDGPMREELEQRARDRGCEPNVEFAGVRSHRDVLELMASARVFCLAAKPADDGDMDAMPVVLREAMARATPVISTRISGIPESVDEDVGWLVDADSADQVAEAISAALGDEEGRSSRGDAARERALTRWSFERQSQTLLTHFSGD